MKIPLLNEIHPFDNSVKVYKSISGHTFENWSSEKPDLSAIFFSEQIPKLKKPRKCDNE